MELDFKEILLLVNLTITTGGFILVKFNDLRHLAKDVTELSTKVDKIDEKLNRHEVDIAVLKEKSNKRKRKINQ